MVFNILKEFYNHHHSQGKAFLSPQKETFYQSELIPYFSQTLSSKQPLITDLLSVHRDLPVLDISYKRNHIILIII